MTSLHGFSLRALASFGGMLFAAAALGGPAPPARAALLVSAVVPRHASIRFTPPASIQLSEEDVARGYVEAAAIELAVQSNAPQGYTLAFGLEGAQVRSAQVLGEFGSLRFDSAGAMASRPAAGTGMWRDHLLVRLRFELSPQATPGRYPWPLRVLMVPH